MNTNRKIIGFLLLTLCVIVRVSAQNNDSTINKLTQYVSIIDQFSKNLPQEKVYLHFDNSTYYQGDDIWFNCYLVTSAQHEASPLSKTLYVELLNPGGEVINKQILKVENGRCHGNFTLNKLPFYSGFYEVRAYTQYMLNFGEDVIFSRTFAIYDKPTKQGAYEEKSLMNYGGGLYPILRESPVKEKKVTLKFFPEGGNLINGVPSRIAFEATDAKGNPIEVSGAVVNENQEAIVRFKTVHDGRGVFTYTPGDKIQSGNKAPKITVTYQNKPYQFDLPAVLPKGIALKVDNLSSPNSIGISLQSNSETPHGIFGLVLMSGCTLQKYLILDNAEGKPLDFKIDKQNLPAGVSRIILFNAAGKMLGDRLLFIHRNEKLSIQEKTDKASYNPYEQVNMQFAITEKETIPVETTFSVSVKDGQNDIKPDQDIQSNLLLMSEIKGYVHDPAYYFESTDSIHQQALDLLLMVQGWHRYSWAWVDGTKPFEMKHLPEKGIEVNGQVVSYLNSVPEPKVNVSTLICLKSDSNKIKNSFMENFVTDSLGRFSFNADVEGRWNMIFAVTEKGKKKNYRTLLDKLSSPQPRQYRYNDLFVHIPNPDDDNPSTTDPLDHTVNDSILIAIPKINDDTIALNGEKIKVLQLKEVVIKAKTNSNEMEILDDRTKSVIYYDVLAEQDKLRDEGGITETDLNNFLMKMNKDFHLKRGIGLDDDTLWYKTLKVLFVLDHKIARIENSWRLPLTIRADYIKSLYISENVPTIITYGGTSSTISCVVFLEMYPDWNLPAKPDRGVRKTWLDGYSEVKEFYSPNYKTLPPEDDYRRTLYWNPSVKTDKDGKALIQFYNNSSCRNFSISAETITPQGVIGVLKK